MGKKKPEMVGRRVSRKQDRAGKQAKGKRTIAAKPKMERSKGVARSEEIREYNPDWQWEEMEDLCDNYAVRDMPNLTLSGRFFNALASACGYVSLRFSRLSWWFEERVK